MKLDSSQCSTPCIEVAEVIAEQLGVEKDKVTREALGLKKGLGFRVANVKGGLDRILKFLEFCSGSIRV